MNNQPPPEENDLIANYHLLPEPVQEILLSFDEEANGMYNECTRVISELEKHGYTADYDLSGALFDLKKIEEDEN